MSSSFGSTSLQYGAFGEYSFRVFDIRDGRIVDSRYTRYPPENLEQYRVVFTPYTPADRRGDRYGDVIYVAVKTAPSAHSIYQIDDNGLVSKERDVDRAVSSSGIGVYFDLVFNDIEQLQRFVYHFEKNIEFFESDFLNGQPPTSADLPPEGGPPSGQEDPPAGQAGHPGSAALSVLPSQ
jgi:hypothetical protein